MPGLLFQRVEKASQSFASADAKAVKLENRAIHFSTIKLIKEVRFIS